MSKIGEFHFVSESYLLDFRGRVTIPMMGNYLLHASSTHAEQRGFGFNAMASQGCLGAFEDGDRDEILSHHASALHHYNLGGRCE